MFLFDTARCLGLPKKCSMALQEQDIISVCLIQEAVARNNEATLAGSSVLTKIMRPTMYIEANSSS
jgi:hypothetical protein